MHSFRFSRALQFFTSTSTITSEYNLFTFFSWQFLANAIALSRNAQMSSITILLLGVSPPALCVQQHCSAAYPTSMMPHSLRCQRTTVFVEFKSPPLPNSVLHALGILSSKLTNASPMLTIALVYCTKLQSQHRPELKISLVLIF